LAGFVPHIVPFLASFYSHHFAVPVSPGEAAKTNLSEVWLGIPYSNIPV
jgi:hypothetical protein